ncbi:hypothetical protein ELD05_00355 [Caldicellulosiruptor changbaiensis]|uniref:Uncharacterized protein n=1 Tax=Caldicellulosiruptor changbaiensis TaxID=1222016 RepID=A0A3T0D259_9FIRM|nr:hypothetical protein [Caldicellulosiruptor changbaiensis]AZT89255.1 hypothetical protein ELD05_00355 [Caldicellulosiruptor changbaiensis]
MAVRPVFLSTDPEEEELVKVVDVEFEWYAGFSLSQKQKCIESLHKNFIKEFGSKNILEISTKSNNKLGVELSAFNLKIYYEPLKKLVPVENVFQASKVFEGNVQYLDLLEKTPIEAKKDSRLRNSGKLIYFKYNETKWELEPKTLFYDWLYINALYNNKELAEKIISYEAFTDIEFNPEKSYNCQARSAALYVSFYKRKLFPDILDVEFYKSYVNKNSKRSSNLQQISFE